MAKTYINVAYQDREMAKRLGARWDSSVRRWYCPPGSALAKVYSWRKPTSAFSSQKLKAEIHPPSSDAESLQADLIQTSVLSKRSLELKSGEQLSLLG